MNKLHRIDVFLSQVIQNTSNIKNAKTNVIIGRFSEYINYKNNNPFDINIYKNNKLKKIKTDLSQKFDLQYVHRIYKSPFYLSFFANNDLQLKILDFYTWDKHTAIYRLFIFKSVQNELNKNIVLKFNFKNKFENNNLSFLYSGKTSANSNVVSTELAIDSTITGFAKVIEFDSIKNSSIALDTVLNKFYSVYDICRNSHISKYFVTKNLKAEQELDKLWNEQKYILPDLDFDNQSLNSKDIEEVNIWIKEFYNYFNNGIHTGEYATNIKGKSNLNITSKYILDYLPSGREIIDSYLNPGRIKTDFGNAIQNWWDVYSLPIYENIFKYKCLNNISEVFCVYLLSIRYNMPWTDILYEKIIQTVSLFEKSSLLNFLILLAYLHKRISIYRYNNDKIYYSPGYFWDNNYKSLINKSNNFIYEVTRFSKSRFIRFSHKDGLMIKIDKLCILIYNEKNKEITLKPYISNFNNQNIEQLEIKIDEFHIVLPLIWRSGSIEINHIRFNWILKKNRYQFTILGNQDSKIQLNGTVLELVKGKKANFYLEIMPVSTNITMSILNRRGGSLITGIRSGSSWLMISGYAHEKFGTITNNVLYSADIRKHKLFNENSDSINSGLIRVNNKCKKLNFYIKHFSKAYNISYIKDQFIDKLFHLNFNRDKKLLLLIDEKFLKNHNEIIVFFDLNFKFKPEYFSKNDTKNIDFKSNLVIEFKHIQKTKDLGSIKSLKKNQLTINCINVNNGLTNLKNMMVANLKNMPQ